MPRAKAKPKTAATPSSGEPQSAAPSASRLRRLQQGKQDSLYQVASVEPTAAPSGIEGESWCEYVLDNGYSRITGCRRGSLQQVTDYARRYTSELNERWGSIPASVWSQRIK